MCCHLVQMFILCFIQRYFIYCYGLFVLIAAYIGYHMHYCYISVIVYMSLCQMYCELFVSMSYLFRTFAHICSFIICANRSYVLFGHMCYLVMCAIWSYLLSSSQRTLTMFVGVVALRYVVLITECHNSHKHSQSPWTSQPIIKQTQHAKSKTSCCKPCVLLA